jgi:hypothetical protein
MEAPTPALTPPLPPTDAPAPTPIPAAYAGMHITAIIPPLANALAVLAKILAMTLSCGCRTKVQQALCLPLTLVRANVPVRCRIARTFEGVGFRSLQYNFTILSIYY